VLSQYATTNSTGRVLNCMMIQVGSFMLKATMDYVVVIMIPHNYVGPV